MTFFADHLWNSHVPLELRRAAIGAMFDLYAKLFALHPTEGGTYTWWDLLASNVIEEQRRPRAVAGLPSLGAECGSQPESGPRREHLWFR